MRGYTSHELRKKDKMRVKVLLGLLAVMSILLPINYDLTACNASSKNSVVSNSGSEEFVTSKSWITPAVIHDSDEDNQDYDNQAVVKRGNTLPAKYDSREMGWVTPVKDQGNYETCWSFATASIIESNLIKNGLAGPDINISENSIAYFFYNRQVEKLGYTKGDYNKIARTGYNYRCLIEV